MIRVETLSQSAKALLPPHKCGGFHHTEVFLNRRTTLRLTPYYAWSNRQISVTPDCVDALYAAFLNESRTRGRLYARVRESG
jgi:hypothetical protein